MSVRMGEELGRQGLGHDAGRRVTRDRGGREGMKGETEKPCEERVCRGKEVQIREGLRRTYLCAYKCYPRANMNVDSE